MVSCYRWWTLETLSETTKMPRNQWPAGPFSWDHQSSWFWTNPIAAGARKVTAHHHRGGHSVFFHQRAVHPIPPMLDAPRNHGECRGSKQIWLGPSYGGHFRQLLTQAGFFGLEFGENSAFSKPCLWTARDFGPVLPPAMSRNII